ncbi:NAD binding domain of 6-phosphogluconate dehydrogenase-domain-containing protein [Dipodascopsis uninucleata]
MVSENPKIGFCGLGAMGGGMARNLVKLGFSVTGYDVYPPAIQKFVDAGGVAGNTPAAAAQDAEFFILMVVNDVQADQVLFGENGGVSALNNGSTIILCSTTPPHYLLDLREKLDATRPDLKLLDCPVSGGSIRAGNGTLSIFSSGSDEDLDNADVVLKAMSDPLYRIPGGISMGSIAKMCHQHQAVTNIITASEAMGLAAAAGLNTQEVYDKVMASTGASWMFGNRVPHMLKNDYLTVHSAVSIINKDAGIVTAHAKRTCFPLILANTAEQLYIQGSFAGLTKEDDAGLVRIFLPKDQGDLVGNLTTSTTTTGKADITVDTIIDVMSAIHLASTRECMAFAEHVGMDIELLKDIIIKGAGHSAMFESSVSELQKTKWNLKSYEPSYGVLSHAEQALEKAREFKQALPMTAAAVEQLHFYL